MTPPILSTPKELNQLTPQIISWVQAQLDRGGYACGAIDGICGRLTLAALDKFKGDNAMQPGPGVDQPALNLLATLAPPAKVSEQGEGLNQKPLAKAGSRTGPSAMMPIIGKVFANEWIAPNSYITWGEATKNLSRLPKHASEVRNLQQLAAAFGRVRTEFRSPLGITSGFRPAYLKIGVANSQHIPGKALDMYPLNGDFSTLLKLLKAEPAFRGIGLGQDLGFFHGDIRDGKEEIFRY